ncbi:hypothetical protein GH714_022989 [Hevea brasiliensis]|uniref:Uncharacterized protein n=1 Tax=Hevea brasiliensis TaxID=3981 RepID=A0A6A6NIU2_HEVBR|nr:hypothetical protein GH714_022989 [Hevea brasiliensis]
MEKRGSTSKQGKRKPQLSLLVEVILGGLLSGAEPWLLQEENPASTNNCRNENSKNDYQGILIKDDSKQESINSCDNYSGIEELPSPVFDSHSLYVQENRIENDSGEESPLMEVVEEGIEEKEASDDVKIGERISSMHLVEENGDDDQEEETKEESPLVEINALKKEEPIDSLKICEEKNSSVHSVKEQRMMTRNTERSRPWWKELKSGKRKKRLMMLQRQLKT